MLGEVLEATRSNIRRLLAAHHYRSVRQLALAAGLNQPTLSRFLDGKTTAMDLKNLLALAEHLGVTVSQLIGETKIADDPRLDQLLRLWDKLPDAGRTVLLVTAAALLAGARQPNP